MPGYLAVRRALPGYQDLQQEPMNACWHEQLMKHRNQEMCPKRAGLAAQQLRDLYLCPPDWALEEPVGPPALLAEERAHATAVVDAWQTAWGQAKAKGGFATHANATSNLNDSLMGRATGSSRGPLASRSAPSLPSTPSVPAWTLDTPGHTGFVPHLGIGSGRGATPASGARGPSVDGVKEQTPLAEGSKADPMGSTMPARMFSAQGSSPILTKEEKKRRRIDRMEQLLLQARTPVPLADLKAGVRAMPGAGRSFGSSPGVGGGRARAGASAPRPKMRAVAKR